MAFLDRSRDALTNLISVFNPKAALRRQQSYMALQMMRSYEAASVGRRTAGWKARSSSANEEVRGAGRLLRDRSREMFRNNPYARRAIVGLADNMIGTGIRPSPVGAGKQADKRIKKMWSDWANKVKCDWDGKHNLYGLQWLAVKTLFESGEVLIVRRWVNDPRLAMPIQLQVLEPDYIDQTKELRATRPGQPEIIQGIQYDGNGKRIGIWLYDRHPGDGWYKDSKLVSLDDVIHIYPVERAGQVRGVPVGTASMVRLRDMDEYEDAQLIKQKIAACFGAFITDDGQHSSGVNSSDDEELEKFQPGMIEYLAPGKQVSVLNPPSVEGYDVYTRTILRAIAAGYGVTYEMMSGDLSNVNFSSGRMGWIEFQRLVTRMQDLVFVPQMCDPIWEWFMQAAVVSMQLRQSQVADVTWTAPRREMIDPVKEMQGIKEKIRTGVTSWQETVRELGYDPQDVIAELAADRKMFKDSGLEGFEWDPAVAVKGGPANQPNEPANPQDGSQ